MNRLSRLCMAVFLALGTIGRAADVDDMIRAGKPPLFWAPFVLVGE